MREGQQEQEAGEEGREEAEADFGGRDGVGWGGFERGRGGGREAGNEIGEGEFGELEVVFGGGAHDEVVLLEELHFFEVEFGLGLEAEGAHSEMTNESAKYQFCDEN